MFQEEILNKIEQASIITIYRHIKPDGDAYGSQCGLKKIIEDNFPGKKIYLLGSQNAHWGKLMSKMDENVSDETIKSSLAIVLDTANKDRVDDERFATAKDIIKIDHHLFVEKLGSSEWVDSTTIATCEMLTKFAIENQLKLSKDAATYLYAGLVTDSGRFQFQNTTAQTFRCAAALIEAGVEMSPLYDFIYETLENEVRYRGYCELNYQTTEHGVAYMLIKQDLLDKFEINDNLGSGFVNCLSNIKGIKMWVFFSQKDDGKVKVELRSAGLPVNEVAKKYGGGGHKLASGAVIENWDIVNNVLDDLDKVCADNE